MAAQLFHHYSDPSKNFAKISYTEYNKFEPEDNALKNKMQGRVHAVTGFEGDIWQWSRTCEHRDQTCHEQNAASIASSLMTLVFNIICTKMHEQNSMVPEVSFVVALTPDRSMEGTGYPYGGASTMMRTCKRSIVIFLEQFRKWCSNNQDIMTEKIELKAVVMTYSNDDLTKPIFSAYEPATENSTSEPVSVYLKNNDVFIRLGSGSLRVSQFVGNQGRIHEVLSVEGKEMSELDQSSLGNEEPVYGCAVRVRGGEAHQGEYFDRNNEQVHNVEVHFVAIQLHRHCLSIFQMILPFYEMGFLQYYRNGN